MTIPPLMQVQTHAPRSAAAANWWEVAGKTCVAAYQPKGAASQAASYSNLANPGTHDFAVYNGSPTWSAGAGWGTSSGNSYGISNAILTDRLVWTIIARATPSAMPQAEAMVLFVGNDFGGWGLTVGSAGTAYVGVLIAGIVWRTTTYGMSANTSAVLAASRDADGNLNIYVDGSNELATTGTPSAPSAFCSVGVDTASGPGRYFAGATAAMALYSDALTAGEISTVSAAMAAL